MTQSKGRPLPPGLKARMERVFQADFSEVRVHPGSHRAKAIGAAAFAIGDDVYFGPDAFKPDSPEGQELIAHELAHVVQQRNKAHIEPTLQGRAQAQPAVGKMVKLWKLKS